MPITKFEFRVAAAPISGHGRVNARIVSGMVDDMVSVVITAPEILSRLRPAIFMPRLTAMYNNGTIFAPVDAEVCPSKALIPSQNGFLRLNSNVAGYRPEGALAFAHKWVAHPWEDPPLHTGIFIKQINPK